MNKMQRGIITLIKSAVTGENLVLPANFAIERVFQTIKAHHIVPLVYEGALRCGVDRDMPIMQQMFQYYCKAAQFNKRQMQALENVFAAFADHKIDYMPLKGCIIKDLYQKPEHRMMGDADVLIRMEQYEKIVSIMRKQGFHVKTASEHHFAWESNALRIELHRSLFAEHQGVLFSGLGDGWALATKNGNGSFAMTPEDTYVYLFTHMTKHFRAAGIGCRQLVDLWVFRRSYPELEEKKIQEAMERLCLGAFYQNICRTLALWFEDGESDEVTELITQVIFANGSWGNSQRATLSFGVRDEQRSIQRFRGRTAYIVQRIFPCGEYLRVRYPILKKSIFLLPAVWIYHLAKRMLFEKGSLRRHVRNLSMLTKENVEKRRQMLETVGLDFYH